MYEINKFLSSQKIHSETEFTLFSWSCAGCFCRDEQIEIL